MSVDVRERARMIAARLSADVAKISPEGIGRWPRTWDLVAEADAEFMLALVRWETSPLDEAAKEAVRVAYKTVLEAWKEAARQYQEQHA